ncbi:MAG: hypothetical protein R6W71_00410 [Bacteroidales bacterium]|jgi:hypothetical protein
MEQVNKPEEKIKQSRLIMWIAIILGVAVIALIIVLFMTRSSLKNLLTEKELQRTELRQELDSLLGEHEKVKIEYGQITDSLMVKDSVIQANAKDIRRLLDTEWEYYKVRKKLAQLQLIAQGYVRQMDSLYRVNAALEEVNIAMQKDLKDLRNEKDEIERDRRVLSDQVEIAAILRAVNMEATGLRVRGGGDRETPTDKVQRVDQVRVCFTVGENKIAAPGKKDIHIRIARPDQEILVRSRLQDYTFEYQGELLQYSMMKTIDYQNEAIDLCAYWNKEYSAQEMRPGLYHVDIFCEDAIIGHTTFTLR